MYSALISQSLIQKQNSFYCLLYIKEFNEKKFNCSNNRYFIERIVLPYYCCKIRFLLHYFSLILQFAICLYPYNRPNSSYHFKRILYLAIFVVFLSNQLQAYVQGIKNLYASLIEGLSIVMIPLFCKYEKRGICVKALAN